MKIKILTVLIFVTLVSLPLYLIRCKTFSFCNSPIPFTFLEILILLTFFVWFFEKYKKKKNIQKIVKEIRSKIPLIVQILILLFLVFPFISIFFSPNVSSALGMYKAYFLEPFLFFIVVFDYLSETKDLKLVLWGLFLSGVWISLLTVVEKVIGYSPFNLAEFAERGRTSAIYQTSNSVGLLLGPILVILFGYLLFLINSKKNEVIFGIKENYLIIASLLIIILGIGVSGSRGAMLGIVASGLFFFGFILYKKIAKKFTKKIIKNSFLAFTIVFFIFNLIFLFNVNSIIEASKKAEFFPQASLRLCLWESSVNIIKENPIVGSGLGGFAIENTKHHTCSQEETTYPHNIILNFWTETGIFGLISFVSVCTWFFFNLLKDEKINYLKLGLATCFISILFHGLVDVPYLKNDLSAAFWAILALSLFLINEDSLFKVVVRRVESVKLRR